MKRPLAYVTAAWYGGDSENAERAAQYCRAVYEAGFSPICPTLYLPLFLNDAVPEEHKSGIDMSRDLLRRSHVPSFFYAVFPSRPTPGAATSTLRKPRPPSRPGA